jgi:hypothetical protein
MYNPDRREVQVRVAIARLKDARDNLRNARAPQARAAVARALKSTKGALRHVTRGLPPSKRRASRPALRLFLVITVGDVEPELRGPFCNEAQRIAAARAHRATDPEKRDGLFRLDVSPRGRGARVWSFAGWEADPDEEMCRCGHARVFHGGNGHGVCGACVGKAVGCARFTWTGERTL